MNQVRPYVEDVRTQIIVLSLLFMAAYLIPLKSMVNIWWTNEDYGYAFLIPLISGYLLWEKRKYLREIPVKSAWGLLPFLLLFTLISLYGILGSSGNVSMPSVPLLIILYAGFCFGIESIKRLSMPFGMLFLMVPPPDILERYLGLHLKAISSKMGGAFIAFFNIPVNVSGNIIDLGSTQLQVVDACSGLRYIFPLLTIGVLYAYFFERVLWKRLFFVLVTIPLGVFINALRIGVTGVLTEIFGPKISQGFFHSFSGWILFLFAFGLLFLLGRILAVLAPNVVQSKSTGVSKPAPTALLAPESERTTKAFWICIILLSLVALLSLSTSTLPAVEIKGGIESFPVAFGEWSGRQEIVAPDIVRESGAEESYSCYFKNRTGDEIALYMGYRSTAFLADENFFHSPTVCIPSSGWIEREVMKKTILRVPFFNELQVTKMLIEKNGIRQLVYFWFQTKDEATYDKNINRFYLSLHALRRDNTHDLFLRPITLIHASESIADAETRLDGFVREMMPVLLNFLKEKQISRQGA
jgi:exosortase D (VPLPA-CTERM-specific)